MRARKRPDSAPCTMRWSYVDVTVITFEMPRRPSVRGAIERYSAG